MVAGQAAILVEVVGLDLGEVEVAGLIALDEALVGADGSGAGGKAEHAVGLGNDLGGHDVAGLAAHVLVILGANDSHNASFP